MSSIDTPVSLKYSNGNNFPKNFIFIAYAVLPVALIVALTGSPIIGILLFVLDLFVLTNRHVVEVNTEQNFVHDYSMYLGFIKIGKKYPLDKYKYITAMPLIESNQVMANYAQSTTITKSYHTITLFGNRFKGKRTVTKFDSKSEAEENASKLADRLELTYFDYDPKLVREVLLGQRTL